MKILSPAKINLFLHVTGKTSDGYHNLVTLMCGVSLYDTIFLKTGVKKTTVSCSNPKVPEDETNIAFKAADLFFNRLNRKEGVKITIKKKIPVAAGLGGGSSNAAAVFLGLNRCYGYPFCLDELMAMGISIGADVPFLLLGKAAWASGIGEKLEACDGLPSYKILLVYPGFGVSTAEVYKNVDLGLTKCKKTLKKTLLETRTFNAACHLCNDLERVVVSKHSEITAVKEALLGQGAKGALMSGSGPTVFGLFSDQDKALAANRMLSKNSEWQLFLTDMIIDDGCIIQDS
ncbi:MAG: 4-(cytidine 5'-diphospho)-2-C-methyl-D-erythritol kinase [Thermodesulfobacteriota bacterium]|nr:4-(cytidine 5'-diphospho)-2-C-methyl-D-erythritol kinase [Thermodesulfobacteriota bacterium]